MDRVCARILFNALLGNISSEAERENDGVFLSRRCHNGEFLNIYISF